jgi:hypothetical protein
MRRLPRCVDVFRSTKSPIVPQLFYSFILIVKQSGFIRPAARDNYTAYFCKELPVAEETREGDVYRTLLEKLEQARQTSFAI